MSCFKKKLLMYHFQICFLNPRMNNNSKNIFFHLKIKVKGMLIIVKLTVKRKKKGIIKRHNSEQTYWITTYRLNTRTRIWNKDKFPGGNRFLFVRLLPSKTAQNTWSRGQWGPPCSERSSLAHLLSNQPLTRESKDFRQNRCQTYSNH